MAEVICAANVERLLSLGRPDNTDHERPNRYAELGLSAADKDELLRMALDDRLHDALTESDAVYGPIHALRALGEFRVVEMIEPMLGLLDEYPDDDWIHEDAADLLPKFGAHAVAPAAAWMRDLRHRRYARATAIGMLGKIARQFPELRSECIAHLASQLELMHDEPEINGFIVSALLDAKAVEAADLIHRAYDLGIVDESMCGEWPGVEYELGLREQPPQEHRRQWFWEQAAPAGLAYDLRPEERAALKKQRKKQAEVAAREKKKLKLAKKQQKRNR